MTIELNEANKLMGELHDDIQENTDSMEEKLEAISSLKEIMMMEEAKASAEIAGAKTNKTVEELLDSVSSPVVEGEWEKELLGFLVQMQVPDEVGAVEIEVNDVIEYVRTLLHSEREKGAAEIAGAEPKCTCGEPHISDRIIHRYDGEPCYVNDSVSSPVVEGEWEKRLEDDFADMLNLVESHAGVNERGRLIEFITNLLNAERAKAWEGKAVQEAYEQGKSHARCAYLS